MGDKNGDTTPHAGLTCRSEKFTVLILINLYLEEEADGGKLAKEEVDQKKENVEKKEETKPEQVWFQPRSQGLVQL